MFQEGESNPEIPQANICWGVKLTPEILDQKKLDETLEMILAKGVKAIEVPHNLQKDQLSRDQAQILHQMNRRHPDLQITIHENVGDIWPYDYREEDEEHHFEPKAASVWAHELGKNDIQQMVLSACEAIDRAKEIGASVVTIHPIGAFHGYAPAEFQQYDQMYFQAIAKYLAVVNEGPGPKIKVGIENFVFPYGQSPESQQGGVPEWQSQNTDFNLPNRLANQIKILEGIDSPDLGFTLDIGHAYWSEEANIDAITQVISRLAETHKLFHIHLHDTRQGQDLHLPPGQGDIDFSPIFKILEQVEYQGVVEIEVKSLSDALEGPEYLKPK